MLAITMFADVFSKLLAFCREHLLAGICAAFGCLLSGTIVAAPGDVDTTFGSNGSIVTEIGSGGGGRRVIVLPDDRFLIIGVCAHPLIVLCIARYDSNGLIDSTFGTAGVKYLDTQAGYSVYVDASIRRDDGSILLAGTCSTPAGGKYCIWRLTENADIDITFNARTTPGYVSFDYNSNDVRAYAIAIDRRGRILVTGTCPEPKLCIARLLANGEFDTEFSSSVGTEGRLIIDFARALIQATSLAVQTDEKIVVAGFCHAPNGNRKFCAIRLSDGGAIDTTFGPTLHPGMVLLGGATQDGNSTFVSLDAQGRIVVAGTCFDNNVNSVCSGRLLSDGNPDFSYGASAGFSVGPALLSNTIMSGSVMDVQVQEDGKLVSIAFCKRGGSVLFFCIARNNADGSTDSTFGSGGAGLSSVAIRGVSDNPSSGHFQSNGNLIVSGGCAPSASSSSTGGGAICAVRMVATPYASATCSLNVDGSLATHVLSDGVLVLRYLLGLRGAALTTGALGPNPTRTGQALEDHLASLNLDADGDGQALAMTDGLLILRAMLGLTGTALTQGATNASHPNVRNAQQILTWIESTHGVACLPSPFTNG